MQKLNRFVTYIYSYRDSQRDTNVGFAKVDCRGGIVRLEIQIRKKIKETKIRLPIGEQPEVGNIYLRV